MKKNVLILDCTGDDWTDHHLAMLNGVIVDSIYQKKIKLLRGIRRFCYKFRLFNNSYWYGSWKYDLDKYNTIIIFSCLLGSEIFSWIRKKGYNGRLIFYYRDPQSAKYLKEDCKAINLIKNKCKVELWTFDHGDAVKYSIKYNPQFYFYTANNSDISDIYYDAVYVGSLRGRSKEIQKIYHELKTSGLKVKFIVKKEEKEKINVIEDFNLIDKNISYEEVLKLNNLSKAIVEINQSQQNGLTVRALEALFTEKKLITNNLDIINMDFYNKNNIFIIGQDSLNLLRKFIDSDYEKIPKSIIDNYSAEKWMYRFM